MGDRRLGWAIAINLGLTVVQIVGGLAAGSLALVADALHNLSDAASLILALVARRFARRPSGPGMTFGHGRVEVVAALVNLTALAMLAFYLALEGLARLAAPEPVDGWPVIWIAALALAVDAGTALVTRAMAKESVNIRAAYLHNLADALGSIAVMVAGAAVLLFGWTWVDPAVTLMIAGYLMWQVKGEAGPVLRAHFGLAEPEAMVA